MTLCITVLVTVLILFLMVIAYSIDSYNDLTSSEENMCECCDIYLSGEYHDIYTGLNPKCEAYILGTTDKCPNYT